MVPKHPQQNVRPQHRLPHRLPPEKCVEMEPAIAKHLGQRAAIERSYRLLKSRTHQCRRKLGLGRKQELPGRTGKPLLLGTSLESYTPRVPVASLGYAPEVFNQPGAVAQVRELKADPWQNQLQKYLQKQRLELKQRLGNNNLTWFGGNIETKRSWLCTTMTAPFIGLALLVAKHQGCHLSRFDHKHPTFLDTSSHGGHTACMQRSGTPKAIGLGSTTALSPCMALDATTASRQVAKATIEPSAVEGKSRIEPPTNPVPLSRSMLVDTSPLFLGVIAESIARTPVPTRSPATFEASTPTRDGVDDPLTGSKPIAGSTNKFKGALDFLDIDVWNVRPVIPALDISRDTPTTIDANRTCRNTSSGERQLRRDPCRNVG
nr:hypothetical protein Iba_chr04fCG15540 [Ipomoea batatas]